MLRQIVLDTETTGLSPDDGHRIIEIGCIELVDRAFSGRRYHTYLNPLREVDDGAFRVHGISTEFLKDKPLFSDVLAQLLEFIQGAELIIHNAPFDVGFLNAELQRVHWPRSLEEECHILDTLVLAREKHPGQRNSLDALCKRYDVDNSNRQWHGALLDADILARVYLAMTGGQTNLLMEDDISTPSPVLSSALTIDVSKDPGIVVLANADELVQHEAFMTSLA